jgi:hypothetical protein
MIAWLANTAAYHPRRWVRLLAVLPFAVVAPWVILGIAWRKLDA